MEFTEKLTFTEKEKEIYQAIKTTVTSAKISNNLETIKQRILGQKTSYLAEINKYYTTEVPENHPVKKEFKF